MDNAEYAQPDYIGAEELELSRTYLTNTNRFVAALFLKHIQNCRSVIDFGAGIGTIAELITLNTCTRPVCVEIDSTYRQTLQAAGFSVHESIDDVSGTHDCIYSSHTLEHIEDDDTTLRTLHARLKKGSSLLLYLPAFSNLYSGLDKTVGHHRRYGKNEIVNKLENAGFTIECVHYVDSLGFFAAYLVKLFGYNTRYGLGSPVSLIIYDKIVFPISRLLDRLGLQFLYGKNIFIKAIKH